MTTGRDGTAAARVTRTGIALVHEGEIVLPAAGSEAQAEQVLDDANGSIQYVFPVEVEVVTGSAQLDPHHIADLALDKLARSVRAQQV